MACYCVSNAAGHTARGPHTGVRTMATEIQVFTGDTLDSAGGRKHMKALVKAVREANALSRGMRKAKAREEGKGNWTFWIGTTCPNVPREEYAGEGGRAKRLALLAAAGDEQSAKALALREAREAGEEAPKRTSRKRGGAKKEMTITIG